MMRIFLIAAIAVLTISAHDHHHGGGGSDHHHSTSDSGHHHHHGGGGGDHHPHHHHPVSDFSSSNYDSSSSGGSGGIGLGQLLFGGLFRRRNYYPSYYGYGNYNRGYCRVAQFVDYVGQTPRYYCDCPPFPPNYQWNQCVPMANYAYGKK
ncbi:unnamed protein product [Caenorhabditis nigoni]